MKSGPLNGRYESLNFTCTYSNNQPVMKGYSYTAMPVIWAEKYSDLLRIELLRREHVLFWEKYILKFRHHWELNQRSLPFSQNINVTCLATIVARHVKWVTQSTHNTIWWILCSTFSRCGLTVWQIYSSLRFGGLHNRLKYYLEVQISQRVNQYIYNIRGLKGASQEIVVKLSLQVCQPVRHSKRPCWHIDGARQLLMAVLHGHQPLFSVTHPFSVFMSVIIVLSWPSLSLILESCSWTRLNSSGG